MKSHVRFLIGGIGGLTPVLMFLINVDFEKYVADATALKTLGYLVRTTVLFLLGGFIAYLHETETKKFTLFLIGLAAPSLIAGYINSASQSASQPGNLTQGKLTNQSSFSLIPSAYAQDATTPLNIKKFTLPKQSPTEEFIQGLTGMSPKNVWFVIVGSHLRIEDAKKQAESANSKFKDFKAEVYAPLGDNPYYTVVIGANLTQSEAKRLRDSAVQAGFPKDSYYKILPASPALQ